MAKKELYLAESLESLDELYQIKSSWLDRPIPQWVDNPYENLLDLTNWLF